MVHDIVGPPVALAAPREMQRIRTARRDVDGLERIAGGRASEACQPAAALIAGVRT